MRQQQGWWLMCPPHHQAPVAVLGSAQPSHIGAEGQVLCWSKAFQLPTARQMHPSVLGRDQLLFPASRQPGCCCPHADQPHISPHPWLLHSLSCSLDPSASILRKEPLPWNGATFLLLLDATSLYIASLTASSQPVSATVQSIFCNVKLLNEYDKCPLPGRAMPKTVSRSLTAKVILFVKKKGKHYH